LKARTAWWLAAIAAEEMVVLASDATEWAPRVALVAAEVPLLDACAEAEE